MLSDEEKEEYIEHEILDRLYCLEENDFDKNKVDDSYIKAVLNACKEAKNLIKKQSKEIEELKEERKSYAEEYIHNNPWLYKQLNENYILRVESEQKERKAWIKGTNDADELCNKKWEDKIKAKIEEYEKALNIILQKDEWIEPGDTIIRNKFIHYIEFGQSLLEKE